MLQQRKKQILKFFLYVVLLFFFYILQVTPHFLAIGQGKPVWVVAFVVAVAMMESEVTAAVFGILAGMLWDLSFHTLFGFHAIVLLCCGVTVSLFVMYLMRAKLLNALLFVGIIMLLERFLYYVFSYLIWGTDPLGVIVWQSLLPTWLLTLAVTLPLYYLVRAISFRWSDTVRS